MKVKEESEKVGLKLNIQKSNIMAYCLITSWEIDGETEETMTDFIFGGSGEETCFSGLFSGSEGTPSKQGDNIQP